MTSNDTDVSGHMLINLIYRHLKKNGHKEAARVLRKHAPKVGTKGDKVSLNDIFRQWLSEKQEKKNVEDLLERCAGKIHTLSSLENSVSKLKTGKSVAAGRMKDTKKKKTAKTSKKPTAEHASINPTTQDDSDSDSSLDVEKWKRLALQLSDADIPKMDANTSFSTSPVATSNSTKKQKAAKKDKNQSKGKNKSQTKKTKDKTATSQSKTDKTKTHSKSKPKEIPSSNASNVKTPYKNTKDRISVESATPINLSEQAGIPKLDVTGHSNTNSMKVDKVRRKTMNGDSDSNNTETKNGGFEKTDYPLLFRNTHTPSRKAKSKKAFNLPEDFEAPHAHAEIGVQKTLLCLDNETVKTPSKKLKHIKDQIVNPVDVHNSEEAAGADAVSLLLSDQSKINDIAKNSEPAETPSKKRKKSKKANKLAELGAEDTTSPRAGTDVDSYHLASDATKATDQILDSGHIETPKKVKSKKSKPVDFATPSGEGMTEGFFSHSQPQQTKPQAKKSSAKDVNVAVVLPVETTPHKVKKSFVGLNETETPKKKESHLDAFSMFNDMSDAVISETSSKKSKKSKRKRSENSENLPPTATESECDNSQVGNGLVLSDTSIQGVKNRMGSENENESASAVEEGPPEPKKRKKNKKDKKKKTEIDEHQSNIEEVPPTPLSDELTDSIPSSQKKKKKKKKHGDDEMQAMPTASPEEQTPERKKKSKEKAPVMKQN